MPTITNIKAACFAVKYHYSKGYDLLKNPKGLPMTNLRMIKRREGIDPQTLDTYTSYERISKDFCTPQRGVNVEYLDVDRYNFYNKANEKIDTKVHKSYASVNTLGAHFASAEKGKVGYKVLWNRNVDSLHQENIMRDEKVHDFSYIDVGYIPKKTEKIKRSFAYIERENFEDNLHQKELKDSKWQTGFWKTLWHNLTNK